MRCVAVCVSCTIILVDRVIHFDINVVDISHDDNTKKRLFVEAVIEKGQSREEQRGRWQWPTCVIQAQSTWHGSESHMNHSKHGNQRAPFTAVTTTLNNMSQYLNVCVEWTMKERESHSLARFVSRSPMQREGRM